RSTPRQRDEDAARNPRNAAGGLTATNRGRAPRPHPASRAAAALRATGPRRPTSPPGFHRAPAETAAQTDPRGPRGPLANSVAQKVSRVCAAFETHVELPARPP